LQELPSISQVFWETILGLSTLLLVRFGTHVNPITMILRCWACLRRKVRSGVDGEVTMSEGKNPLEEHGAPMTRARVRKEKEALQQMLSILFEYKPKFQGEKTKIVNCIMVQMDKD